MSTFSTERAEGKSEASARFDPQPRLRTRPVVLVKRFAKLDQNPPGAERKAGVPPNDFDRFLDSDLENSCPQGPLMDSQSRGSIIK